MNKINQLFSRRERIVLLVLGLLALIGYPSVRAWHRSQTSLPQIPCQQQIQEADAHFSRKAPACPEGGVIKIALNSTLATHCTKHGAIMQLAPKPPPRSFFEVVGLVRYHRCGNSCIANLKQMDGAAQQWALENKKKDSDEVDVLAAAQYLKGGAIPSCPSGGKYWFTTVSNPPYCTIIGHSLP